MAAMLTTYIKNDVTEMTQSMRHLIGQTNKRRQMFTDNCHLTQMQYLHFNSAPSKNHMNGWKKRTDDQCFQNIYTINYTQNSK